MTRFPSAAGGLARGLRSGMEIGERRRRTDMMERDQAMDREQMALDLEAKKAQVFDQTVKSVSQGASQVLENLINSGKTPEEAMKITQEWVNSAVIGNPNDPTFESRAEQAIMSGLVTPMSPEQRGTAAGIEKRAEAEAIGQSAQEPLKPRVVERVQEMEADIAKGGATIDKLNRLVKIIGRTDAEGNPDPAIFSGAGSNARIALGQIARAFDEIIPGGLGEEALSKLDDEYMLKTKNSEEYLKVLEPVAMEKMATELKGSTAFQELEAYKKIYSDPNVSPERKMQGVVNFIQALQMDMALKRRQISEAIAEKPSGKPIPNKAALDVLRESRGKENWEDIQRQFQETFGMNPSDFGF